MMTTSMQACFEEALDDADGLVRRAAEASLALATPCEGWDLGALLGHMIGQNRGFATAVRAGDAPLAAY
ncbi:MAG: maleylpyruvate isomerase N-terminal domain-containing protein, partial [Nocardioides sp.]